MLKLIEEKLKETNLNANTRETILKLLSKDLFLVQEHFEEEHSFRVLFDLIDFSEGESIHTISEMIRLHMRYLEKKLNDPELLKIQDTYMQCRYAYKDLHSSN
jgi:hypothetical protein